MIEDEAGEAFIEGLDAVPVDSDAWDCRDVFIDVESLLEPHRATSGEPPAGDQSIPADAVLVSPELVDDLDYDLARFEAEHPVPDARPETSRSPEAGRDRHSPEALARVERVLALFEMGR